MRIVRNHGSGLTEHLLVAKVSAKEHPGEISGEALVCAGRTGDCQILKRNRNGAVFADYAFEALHSVDGHRITVVESGTGVELRGEDFLPCGIVNTPEPLIAKAGHGGVLFAKEEATVTRNGHVAELQRQDDPSGEIRNAAVLHRAAFLHEFAVAELVEFADVVVFGWDNEGSLSVDDTSTAVHLHFGHAVLVELGGGVELGLDYPDLTLGLISVFLCSLVLYGLHTLC